MPGPTPRVDRDEFRRLNEAGWTIAQLAPHFGISPTYVSRLRTKLGIVAPTRLNLTAERLARIERMLNDGASFREIRRTEGADMQTLRVHFPGRGWTPEQSADHLRALRKLTPLIERKNLKAAA